MHCSLSRVVILPFILFLFVSWWILTRPHAWDRQREDFLLQPGDITQRPQKRDSCPPVSLCPVCTCSALDEHNRLRALGWQTAAYWVPGRFTRNIDLQSKKWGSQVKQDWTVVHLMQGKRNGFFVDLAANDAVELSNTIALENWFDWTGLCIEANPMYYPGLLQRKCRVVQAAVGNQTMDVIEFNYRDEGYMSGFVGHGFDNPNTDAGQGERVHTVSINKIFEDLHVPTRIDYLSLDIEGAEGFVFQHFAWEKYIFSIMTVERPKPSFVQLAKKYNYVYLCDHGGFGDELWIHESISTGDFVSKYIADAGLTGAKKTCPEPPDTFRDI